jgi:DNA-binding Lrp family transcriptional regulator
MEQSEPGSGVDEFDLLLLEAMVVNPATNYKELAELFKVDQRTVAKRVRDLTSRGILKHAVEVDWSKLGLAQAVVGTTTTRGIDYARKMGEIVGSDPRIVEAYETLGSYHYFMKIIETDTFRMRDSVLRELDVLAADLTTTLITNRIKQDYRAFIRYLRETRFPRSRDRGNVIPHGEPTSPR